MKSAEQFKAGVSVKGSFERAAARPQQVSAPAPRITLRLSNAENAKLRELAAGMSVSAFIRKCVFGGDLTRRKRRVQMPVTDQKAMAQALALLGASRIANNLNQLAYHANTGSLVVDEGVQAKIDEAYAHVRQMRDALIAALGLIEG